MFRQLDAVRKRGEVGGDGAAVERLGGFPAREGVAVVGEQEQQIVVAVRIVQMHRRAEPAQQRGNDGFGYAFEREGLFGFGQQQHGFGRAFALIIECHRFAVAVQQPDFDGNHHRLFVRHIGRRRHGLFNG